MPDDMPKWWRPQGMIWGLLLGCLAFVGLGTYGDMPQVGSALARFPHSSIPALLLLALVNYLLRYLRWELYLRRSKIQIPLSHSLAVFFSGMAFSVTPGKAGELVKSYLLKRGADVPVRQSAPVVVMERVSDFGGVLLLAVWGGVGLEYGWQVLLVSGGLLLGGTILLTSPKPLFWFRHVLAHRRESLLTSQNLFRSLLSPLLCCISLSLAVLAWFAECYGFWLVMQGFQTPLPLFQATFVYTFATLVGALSLLPGGLITTEGSMVAVLTFLQLDPAVAAAATVVIRLCTLWFAVVLGMIGLGACTRQFPGTSTLTPDWRKGDI